MGAEGAREGTRAAWGDKVEEVVWSIHEWPAGVIETVSLVRNQRSNKMACRLDEDGSTQERRLGE